MIGNLPVQQKQQAMSYCCKDENFSVKILTQKQKQKIFFSNKNKNEKGKKLVL